MAVAAIVAQSASLADPSLDVVASALKQTLSADPHYGLPFCRAVDRALEYVHNGIAYESYTATHYRVQSYSGAWLSHYVTLHQCSCETAAPWCWLIHLLTAYAALRQLDRCPRPILAYAPPQGKDMATILREADEIV